MTYTKIKIDFKYGPKNRFFRTILVKGNPNLFELAVMIGTSLGATFEHSFLFRTNTRSIYVMAPFMEDPMEGYKYLGNYHLEDLPSKFSFDYDTGDGWDFKCEKHAEKVDIKSKKKLIIVEGKGQGIWEDNIHSLYAFFEGKIEPESSKEDEKNGIYKPWNFEIEKFSDFDLALNLEEINESLEEAFLFNYHELLKGENAYLRKSNVNLEDYKLG